jgi:hypothetical protein
MPRLPVLGQHNLGSFRGAAPVIVQRAGFAGGGHHPHAQPGAIVDAETGCLLRLISYAGDTLATWSELDDIRG